MASRARQSTAQPMRQATAEPTQRRAGNELPPYEKPSFPLNPAAQRALEQLRRAHDLKNLKHGFPEAQAALSTTAGDINDRLYQKELAAKKRRTERERSGSEEAEAGDEIERSLEVFREKVERMTQRMDESMRKMIDGRHSTQSINDSLAAISSDARTNAATQASTLQARTQQYEDFQPTDPTAGTQDQPTPIESFKSKMEDAKTRYQSYTLNERYANDNDYRNFRRVVNDAKHPDGDVQLAHHSEWFEEAGTAAPGMTGRGRADDEDEDEDDDIAISRTTISTKCPLTLQEFVSPLSSTKCPHSFEAEAISNMISRSPTREVRCPVSGCSQMLKQADLHSDAVLIRRIRRLQRAKELEQEEADEGEDGGDGDGPTVIDDDADDVDDIIEGRSTQVKGEPRTQRGASRAQSTARESRGTPMELDGGGDDDETDDE